MILQNVDHIFNCQVKCEITKNSDFRSDLSEFLGEKRALIFNLFKFNPCIVDELLQSWL